jgi:hypothetical protein
MIYQPDAVAQITVAAAARTRQEAEPRRRASEVVLRVQDRQFFRPA